MFGEQKKRTAAALSFWIVKWCKLHYFLRSYSYDPPPPKIKYIYIYTFTCHLLVRTKCKVIPETILFVTYRVEKCFRWRAVPGHRPKVNLCLKADVLFAGHIIYLVSRGKQSSFHLFWIAVQWKQTKGVYIKIALAMGGSQSMTININ